MKEPDIHLEIYPDVPHYEYENVPGGTLVYRTDPGRGGDRHRERQADRRLHGFLDVTDWDAIRSELARRGHDVGAIHHLPVLEERA